VARLLLRDLVGLLELRFGVVETALASSTSSSGAFQSHDGLAAFSASSQIALMATCICSWPNTTAPSMTDSGSICASDSTISTASAVPATTRSSFDV